MIDYTGLTDEQASAKRMNDKGDVWKICDKLLANYFHLSADTLRQALHDRDRYHRDAEYWREECIKLTGEALA